MMNSRQQEEDERRAIEAYSGDSKFQNLLKNILNKGTGKKVDNFLDGQKLAQNFNNPAGLPQDLYEATMRQYGRKEFGPYTTDDIKLIIEANQKGLL